MSKELSSGVVSLLQDAIDVASMLDIERIVLDGHSLRGHSPDNGTIMLLPFPDDTTLEFGAMGIGRIPELKNRLKLVGNNGKITPEYKERDSGDKFVFRLVLQKGKTKVEFKCSDPAQIRAPKALNDPDHFIFKFTNDDVDLMLKSKTAMGADSVAFVSPDGKEVTFSIVASEGDTLTHQLSTDVECKTDTEKFNFIYKVKILFPVLKEVLAATKDATEVEVAVTRRGVMKMNILDIPVFIFPEA